MTPSFSGPCGHTHIQTHTHACIHVHIHTYMSCVCTEPAPTVPRSKANWILAKAPEDKRHGCSLASELRGVQLSFLEQWCRHGTFWQECLSPTRTEASGALPRPHFLGPCPSQMPSLALRRSFALTAALLPESLQCPWMGQIIRTLPIGEAGHLLPTLCV